MVRHTINHRVNRKLRKMEKVTQTASYWETGIALLERNHTRTLVGYIKNKKYICALFTKRNVHCDAV